MHPRLTELRDYVDSQRSALLSAAAAIPSDRWMERPAPDRWSLCDLFEHLYRVEHGCARMIDIRAREARAAGHPLETDTSSVLGTLDHVNLLDRGRRMTAPERVTPTGGWTREQALTSLARSREELHEAMRAAEGLALGSVMATHARLGQIDLYRWILFVGQHEARHVPQVAEIAEQLAATSR